MLPQATVRWPQAFNICAINSVVVVLPFVPVMAMTGTWHELPAKLQLADRLDVLATKNSAPAARSGSIPGLRTPKS